MKKVLHFFSRTDDEPKAQRTSYTSREPTLNPQPKVMPRNSMPAARQFARPERPSATASPAPASPPIPSVAPVALAKTEPMPTDYAGIVEFFHKKVSERKSPYNALISAADCLKEFIPDETSRLKAVLAVSGEKWPLEALSLAISSHISDIELARTRAKEDTHTQVSDRVSGFRKQVSNLKEQNEKIETEIRSLNDRIKKLEADLGENQSTLDSLNQQIQLAEANANSVSFVDQAADNLKNDLLAKKVILGLP